MRKDTVITVTYNSMQEAIEANAAVIQVGPELITDDQLVAVWAAVTAGAGHVAADAEYELCPSCAAIEVEIAADDDDAPVAINAEIMLAFGDAHIRKQALAHLKQLALTRNNKIDS